MDRTQATEYVSSLYDRWFTVLASYARRLCGSSSWAEDIVQESFLALFNELAAGKQIDNPKAWTLCVVRRQVQKQIREHRRKPASSFSSSLLDRMPAASTGVSPELGIDMARGLEELSAREEEVLRLRLETLKYREIAEMLGISINSVRTHLVRGLRKLRVRTGAGPAPDAENIERKDAREPLQ
jgi:RNA polymerase sigma-70 factor (ECF subfamily)